MRYNSGKYINKSKRARNVKKIIGLCIFSIIIIIIYNAFLLSVSNTEKEQKYVLGFKAFIIETGSMEPELKIGDVIIVKECTPKDLKIGDIITFRSRGELITHRITDINEETGRYSTKGDRNTLNDIEKVKFEEIEGKKVLKLSGFWNFMQKAQKGMYTFFLIVFLSTIFLHSRRVNRKRQMRRNKKKIEDKRVNDENIKKDN